MTRQEAIARDKQGLLDRSAHFRLRLRHESRDVRKALQWPRVAASAAFPIGRLAGGIALAALAAGPMGRFVAFASRTLLFARLLRSVVTFARIGTGRA